MYKDKFSRREFMKYSLGFLAAITINRNGYDFIQLLSAPESSSDNKGSLGGYIDNYPMVPWVLANCVIAQQKINNTVLNPGEKYSLVDTIFPNNHIDYNNYDPKVGFVCGPTGNPANGVCKVATDIFRGALGSTMRINDSTTHYDVSKNHAYFNNSPYGSDSAIYIDPPNVKIDLVIENPWDFPVRIKYNLYNKGGNEVNYSKVLSHNITLADRAMGGIQKGIEAVQEHEIPIHNGLFPTSLVVDDITSVVQFEPADQNEVVPNWSSTIQTKNLSDGNVTITRQLTVEGDIVETYSRTSNYIPNNEH